MIACPHATIHLYMKVVILAGGLGTRLAEDTAVKPKPMVEIGDRPILWHIMKIYAAHGLNDFIICLGYKGYLIKEYFANYDLHNCDVTFDFRTQTRVTHRRKTEDWCITLVDTGADTMTGGRLRRVREHLGNSTFCMTYGDGVGNVDISASIAFHRAHGRKATVTATQPPGRFGSLRLGDADSVAGFEEKPVGDGGWINGGFFVLEPSVCDLIDGDASIWEQEPMKALASADDLGAYRHHGFWQPMDTLRDKQLLESLWRSGNAPWRTWES
jgi:glucose-1-phosphate cytidylyltransferase